MVKPIFETISETAMDLTYRLYCKCEHCGKEYIQPYTNGVSSKDEEKLEELKTLPCEYCSKELGTSPEVSDNTPK